jgi:hypothetical protein
MTAPRKAIARKSAPAPKPRPGPESDRSGWPGVMRFAIESWARTARLCAILLVAGVVPGALIVLRLWLGL